MKAEAVKSVGNVITNTIKGAAKSEVVASSKAVKNGEKLMAVGQDAAAVQGKAMVKPYVKPEMQVHKMEKQNLRAASDGYYGGGNEGGGNYEGGGGIWDNEGFGSGSSIWDNSF